MESPLLEKIKSRGYWRVVIRPTRFDQERIPDITALYPLLQQASVSLRGWDYPHLNARMQPHIDLDWIGQELEWNHRLELWRFYQSGQFVHFFGISTDWREQSDQYRPWPQLQVQPGETFPVTEAIRHFTAVFEFASRLALSDVYQAEQHVHIEIDIRNLQGRSLYDDSMQMPLLGRYETALQEFPFRTEPTREDLIAAPRDLALEPATKLFHRFGWQVTPSLLRNIQAQLKA